MVICFRSLRDPTKQLNCYIEFLSLFCWLFTSKLAFSLLSSCCPFSYWWSVMVSPSSSILRSATIVPKGHFFCRPCKISVCFIHFVRTEHPQFLSADVLLFFPFLFFFLLLSFSFAEKYKGNGIGWMWRHRGWPMPMFGVMRQILSNRIRTAFILWSHYSALLNKMPLTIKPSIVPSSVYLLLLRLTSATETIWQLLKCLGVDFVLKCID